ncbi:MAG: Na(+)/H(+) antiporter subunit D, partial [Deltaproteobacteria bacterium]|nr:Na(+)/H(+) antiporter subunit D [Deltaproteobacteria bacterium]
GFMVVGIGIGTEMSLNGTVAHAFAHILYKALLFMSMGAVLYRAGTIKGSELGGLYKSMPWTTAFCMVGAASISGFPLFSGFISKSLILTAAGDGHWVITWLVLMFASAGVFHHSGIKIPFFAFFAHDSGIRCEEAPRHMLLAMGLTALMCVGLGVYPQPLYDILPYHVDYAPYTPPHVINQLQLLVFSALAFAVLKRTGLYPPELAATHLDSDWSYRRLLPASLAVLLRVGLRLRALAQGVAAAPLARIVGLVYRHYGPQGIFARSWSTGSSVLWVAVILALFLILVLRG